MRKFPTCLTLGLTTWLLLAGSVPAGGKAIAVRETAEYLLGRLGREAGREGFEALAQRLEILASRYGEEALVAVRRAGPAALRTLEQAGPGGTRLVKLFARWGDDAAWVVATPKRTALFLKHGEPAAEALIRHRLVAEPLIETCGQPAVRALNALQPRNARRLAMMQEGGELTRLGRTRELLDVIATHGDRAMDFVWRNKGPLAVTAVLAAFLANPEPFLCGDRDLASVVADRAITPIAEAPGKIAVEVARRTDWTAIFVVLAVVAALWAAGRMWMRQRAGRATPLSPQAD